MRNVRTDLALEAHELFMEAAEEIAGIELSDRSEGEIHITHVAVKDKEASQKIGKPIGNYVTLELPDLRYIDKNLYETACKKISAEIGELLKGIDPKRPILIIGLGNRSITSDSLGPAVIDRLMITRHLFHYAPEAVSDNLGSVCAIAPGVLGVTGIETGEIIAGVCEKVHPCAVICVDALAARNIDRVTRTIQICDTGINPGAGVGNNRKEISQNTLGVSVIAVGVPTVVDAATITDDTLNLVIDNLLSQNDDNTAFFKMLKGLNPEDRFGLIKESVSKSMPNFMTTPKEIDILIDKTAEVVANGINFALHKDITFEDIDIYVS